MDSKRWADPGDLKRCILRSRRRVGWCGFPPDCSYASRARGAPIIRFRTLPRRKSADCRSQEHRFLEQFAHEFHGGSLVAPSLHQQVEDLAFVVDCAPQPELLPAILTTTSSRCQRAVGCGRRRRVLGRTTARISRPIAAPFSRRHPDCARPADLRRRDS
jgi:hypothetical protein